MRNSGKMLIVKYTKTGLYRIAPDAAADTGAYLCAVWLQTAVSQTNGNVKRMRAVVMQM